MKRVSVSERLAFDRSTMAMSVRSKDADGRLHVSLTPISKANVCGYRGREIPNSEALGLDADRLYQLFRDPEELEKAAKTFDRQPLLDEHVPHSASKPQKASVCGTTGSDAVFEAPFLKNSLTVWDADAIKAIEDGSARELSCAYRYRADMSPGIHDGVSFDGVMRDIEGNHVALVAKGRAGPDVIVGDSAPYESETRGKPRMARKILSKSAATAARSLVAALKPHMATDAELSDVIEMLDTLEPTDEAAASDLPLAPVVAAAVVVPVVAPVVPVVPVVAGAAEDDADVNGAPGTLDVGIEARIREILGDTASDDAVSRLSNLIVQASKIPSDKLISTTAMDSAISAAVTAAEGRTIARLQAVRAAEVAVEPYVGKLVAMDSAEAVYGAALKSLGVDIVGVHASAFPAILNAQPKPGAVSRVSRIAADSASGDSKGFAERFPTASRIRNA